MTIDSVTVELGFGSDPLDMSGHVWTDVTEWVEGFSTRRGRTSVSEQYGAGTCVIRLDNRDRRFDPRNLSGPYVSGGETQVVPAVPLRVTITHSTVDYVVWFGFLDDPMGFEDQRPGRSSMTFSATDPMRILAAAQLPELIDPIEEGWLPGSRISRILTQIGWDVSNWAVIDTGDTPLESTRDGGTALTQIQNAALGEAGFFFFRASDQKFVFQNRQTVGEDTRQSTTQFLYQDESYSQPQISNNGLLYNEIRLTRESGALFESRDQASIDKHFLRTLDVSGAPILYDAYAEARTNFYLQAYKDPLSSITGITVQAVDVGSLLHEQVCDTLLRDRVRVQMNYPPGGGDPIDDPCTVESISITGGPSVPLTMVLGLSSWDRYGFDSPGGWLRLDDPFYGELDGPFQIAY